MFTKRRGKSHWYCILVCFICNKENLCSIGGNIRNSWLRNQIFCSFCFVGRLVCARRMSESLNLSMTTLWCHCFSVMLIIKIPQCFFLSPLLIQLLSIRVKHFLSHYNRIPSVIIFTLCYFQIQFSRLQTSIILLVCIYITDMLWNCPTYLLLHNTCHWDAIIFLWYIHCIMEKFTAMDGIRAENWKSSMLNF